MNTEYQVKIDGIKQLTKQATLQALPLIIIGIGGGFAISFFNEKDKDGQNAIMDILPLMILIFLIALGIGIYIGINRQKKLLESYKLTITDRSLIREMFNTPTITIPFNYINSIIKNSDGSFVIKSKVDGDIIGIPMQIEKYDQLEQSLNQIRPLEIMDKVSLVQKMRVPFALLVMVLMATVYIASNKLLVGISGIALSGILGWSIIQIQKNKNIDSNSKKMNYMSIIVLIIIICITIMKVTATN